MTYPPIQFTRNVSRRRYSPYQLIADNVWIFGYGSLIYRPGFEYTGKISGFIKGYKRVWYLLSACHRGTRERPGRVVTLMTSESDITSGIAYCIKRDKAEQIFKNLCKRESSYVRLLTKVFVKENIVGCDAFMYYVNETDPDYSPGEEEEIAQQIAVSVGPTGPNRDYLFNITKSLRENGIPDPQMEKLEIRVRELLQKYDQLHDKYRMKDMIGLNIEKPVGTIIINEGAVEGVVNAQKPLYSRGIISVEGDFESNRVVSIRGRDGAEVSRGVCNYSSEDLKKIIGVHSKDIIGVLGYKCDNDEIVERDNLILV
jgi:cation transport regulator ChaC